MTTPETATLPSPFDQPSPPALQFLAPAQDWGTSEPGALDRVATTKTLLTPWLELLQRKDTPKDNRAEIVRWLAAFPIAFSELREVDTETRTLCINLQRYAIPGFALLLKKCDSIRTTVQKRRLKEEARLEAELLAQPDPDAPLHPKVACLMKKVAGSPALPPGYSWSGLCLMAGTSVVATRPIVVTDRARDLDTGEETLKIAWIQDTVEPQITEQWVPADTLVDSRKIVSLGAYGCPVTSASAGSLVTAIDAMRSAWLLPPGYLASRCGYVNVAGKKAFVWGSAALCQVGAPDVQVNVPPEHASLLSSMESGGTLDGWLQAWGIASKNPIARLVVYTALASILVPLTSKAGCVLDLHSRTTQGKTTALLLAASVFGNPATYVQKWASTATYRERCAAMLQNMPLILDDSKQLTDRDKETIARTVYELADGQGRGRGTIHGVQKRATWQLLTISSGEAALLATAQEEGARGRCLSIGGAPMGSAADANAITQLALSNYGLIGQVFISVILQCDEQKLLDTYARFLRLTVDDAEKYAATQGLALSAVARRLLATVATIRMAADILHALCGVPGGEGSSRAISTAIRGAVSTGEDADRAREALLLVMSRAAAFQGQFFERHPVGSENPPGGWLGRWPRGDDYPFIAILTTTVKKWLTEERYDVASTIEAWRALGWTDCEAGRPDKKVRIGSTTARAVQLIGDQARAIMGDE